jgi:hypothetical protein
MTFEKVSAMTMQSPTLIDLKNTSSSACVVDGYPIVRYLDAANRVVDYDYQDTGDQEVTPRPPQRVMVPGGATAYVLVNRNACVQYTGDSDGTVLSLTLPGDPIAILQPRATSRACPPGDPGHTLHISPIEPSPADTARR